MAEADPTLAKPGMARCSGPSWNDILARDPRPVPQWLREDHYSYLGSDPLPNARYTSPDHFRAECEKMWPNVWQYAGREEDLPAPGDYFVYDNAGRSFLVVRQPDGTIRALHNTCLHRGRQLADPGSHGSVQDFRCGWHGFTYHLDGALKELPCKWDFPHIDETTRRLPDAQVGRWGGYIFIKENPGGPSLADYLSPLPDMLGRYAHEECVTVTWIAKPVRANWKLGMEAFMEAYHGIGTHPRNLPYSADTNSSYNIYGDHVNLELTAFGEPSPHLKGKIPDDQQWILDRYLKDNGRVAAGLGPLQVAPGGTARSTLGDANRQRYGALAGRDYSQINDSEVQDAIQFMVFPNFCPWGGFQPNLVYSWKPWPDQDNALMEVRILQRLTPDKKPTQPVRRQLLAHDEPWESTVLSSLGRVLDEDWDNLPAVQNGLKTSKSQKIELANYQEIRVRHFDHTLNKYLAR